MRMSFAASAGRNPGSSASQTSFLASGAAPPLVDPCRAECSCDLLSIDGLLAMSGVAPPEDTWGATIASFAMVRGKTTSEAVIAA